MAVDYHTQAGLNAYKAYIAIKQHFTKPDFDYFKYGGKTNASLESYKKRKDAIFFEMIGKHPDPISFIAFNIATFDKVYPKDLATGTKYKQNYDKMKAELDSLSYHMRSNFKRDHLTVRGFHNPPHSDIIKDYLTNKVSLIFICAVNACIPSKEPNGYMVSQYDRVYQNDPIIWPRISLKIKKLTPFLLFDRDNVRKALLETLRKQNEDFLAAGGYSLDANTGPKTT